MCVFVCLCVFFFAGPLDVVDLQYGCVIFRGAPFWRCSMAPKGTATMLGGKRQPKGRASAAVATRELHAGEVKLMDSFVESMKQFVEKSEGPLAEMAVVAQTHGIPFWGVFGEFTTHFRLPILVVGLGGSLGVRFGF